jgi:hypothetical protein
VYRLLLPPRAKQRFAVTHDMALRKRPGATATGDDAHPEEVHSMALPLESPAQHWLEESGTQASDVIPLTSLIPVGVVLHDTPFQVTPVFW